MSAVLYRDIAKSYPMAVTAHGLYITDETGKTYLDMSGGAATSPLGHGHPDVTAALKRQIDQMAFAHTAFFTNEPQEKLATALVRHFHDKEARVYFSSGGTEANETALKLAWQYWRVRGKPEKKIIISRDHSYHGNTLGALSISGNKPRRRKMDGLLIDWPRIDPCYAYRNQQSGETPQDYALRTANQLEEAIQKAGAVNVAAFIAEPVVGASLGVVPAEEGYFKRIAEICAANDILLIADEIMCGTGRTGSFFAYEQEGITPDIVTLAKGIGGGYQPLAATIAGSKVHGAFTDAGTTFDHGHTYVGHATACAAGLAVVTTIDDENLLENVNRRGAELETALKKAFGDHPNIGDIRGRGLFWGLEIVADRETKDPFPDQMMITKKLKQAAMANGLICYPGGGSAVDRLGSHILLAPPFILGTDHIEALINKLGAVFDEVLDV